MKEFAQVCMRACMCMLAIFFTLINAATVTISQHTQTVCALARVRADGPARGEFEISEGDVHENGLAAVIILKEDKTNIYIYKYQVIKKQFKKSKTKYTNISSLTRIRAHSESHLPRASDIIRTLTTHLQKQKQAHTYWKPCCPPVPYCQPSGYGMG